MYVPRTRSLSWNTPAPESASGLLLSTTVWHWAGEIVVPTRSAVRQTWNVAPPRSFPLLSFFSQRSEPATNVFTAGPELPDWPLVVRVSETPPTLSVTEAVPVTLPPELVVKVTVHWPLALVPDEAQVSVTFVAVAPLALVRVTAGFTPHSGCVPPPDPSSARTVPAQVG